MDARHSHPLGAGQNTDSETLVKCTGYLTKASLVSVMVKNLPAMQETLVWLLGQEDPPEKGMGIHSSILGLPWWLR